MTPEERLLEGVKELKETCDKANAEDERNGRYNPVYTIFSTKIEELIKRYEEDTFPES